MIKIFVDAATNTTKNLSAGGMLLIENGQQTQKSISLEAMDNHSAEFEILLHALQFLLENDRQKETIFLHSDSKTVVSTLDKGVTKNPGFQNYVHEFQHLSEEFSLLVLKWIPESENKGADQLARQGLQKMIKLRKRRAHKKDEPYIAP
jgi:ribonuclease HI